MAVIVTIEFTDEQWEIVRDNYPTFMKDTDDEVLTPERVGEIVLKDIKNYLLNDMRLRDADVASFKGAFEPTV